jgi:hypothetical protein
VACLPTMIPHGPSFIGKAVVFHTVAQLGKATL